MLQADKLNNKLEYIFIIVLIPKYISNFNHMAVKHIFLLPEELDNNKELQKIIRKLMESFGCGFKILEVKYSNLYKNLEWLGIIMKP